MIVGGLIDAGQPASEVDAMTARDLIYWWNRLVTYRVRMAELAEEEAKKRK